jgi:predicted Zn-dependent protease
VTNYVSFDPWFGQSHYLLQASSSVDITNQRILWKWAAGSSQNYSDEWNNAVAKWNELDPITITETASTPDLIVAEYSDAQDKAVGYYDPEVTPHEINLNKAKLSTRAFNQIQNAATHELGHALGLDHSYWENIMYSRNTFQTTFGPQDTYDYHYQWGN